MFEQQILHSQKKIIVCIKKALNALIRFYKSKWDHEGYLSYLLAKQNSFAYFGKSIFELNRVKLFRQP